MVIHAFNKSGRHLEFLIYDVIRGKTSAAILEVWLAWQYDVRAPERQSQAIMNRFTPFFSGININNTSCEVRLCKSYGDMMFDKKRNTKKCDIRFQAISMY